MMFDLRILTIAGAALLLFSQSAFARDESEAPVEPQPMSPIDMVEIPRFGDVQLSPDGRYLSYTVSRTDWAENEVFDDFKLLDLTTNTPVELALPGDILEELDAIHWRPDSSGFLFRYEEDESEAQPETFTQAYQYTLEDQSLVRMTDHGSDVLDLVWNPNGVEFYFTVRRETPADQRRLIEDDWVLRPYDATAYRELWRFDLSTASASPLIRGDYTVRRVSVSGDGRFITHMRSPEHTPDGLHAGDIWVLDLHTNSARKWTDNAYSEVEPTLSPGADILSYISTVGPDGAPYYEDKVFLEKGDGRLPTRLQSDIGFEANDHVWSADGTRIFIRANTGLVTQLFSYEVETGDLIALTPSEHTVQSWHYAPRADLHVLRLESGAGLGELQMLQLVDGQPVLEPITDIYADWPNRFQLPEQAAYKYMARDGTPIEGLLVYPLDYTAGETYPLVTIIHGGPRSASQFGSWNVSRYLPVLAGQGYMVFLPNHRGGTGYGDAFVRDMFGGYFQNAHLDVMDGVDALITDGLADPDALIIQGWSAGGHMVNRLITETDRFAAAASGAGASDWLSMHGESDVRHTRSFVFGGMPWDKDAPHEQYAADSPLREAWRVTTPTIFWSGENDVRVPPTQSIMMHRAIKAAGADTVFYQADGEPHNFQDPRNRLFKINRELEWYAEHVLGETFTPVLPPEANPAQPAAVAVSSITD